MPPSVSVVIPFFDEAERFDAEGLARIANMPDTRLIAVDDGSRDHTPDLLAAARRDFALEVLTLPINGGKAEAVRAGLRHGLASGSAVVAFADADMAAPPEELARLIGSLTPGLDVVIGARVLLAGRRIERRSPRHYLGRVFATLAANILRTPFYDTQCGAKVFRATPALSAALDRPFSSRWAFDVELLGRLLVGAPGVPAVPPERFREVPLETWIDRGDSKVGHGAKVRMLVDLVAVELELRRLRR